MQQLLNPAVARRWSAAFLTMVTTMTVGCLGAALLLMDSVFWRPLPGVPDAHELTMVTWGDGSGASIGVPLAALPSLEAAAGPGVWCPFLTGGTSRLTIDGVVHQLPTSSWMPSCAAVFKVVPALGTFWTNDPQWHRTVVISHRLWQDTFGGDLSVLGRTLLVDDNPFTITGVAPRSFMGLGVEIQPDVITALTFRSGQVTAGGRPVLFRQLLGRGVDPDGSRLSDVLTARLKDVAATEGFGLSAGQKAGITRSTAMVDQTGRGISYLRTEYAEDIRGVVLIGALLVVMALVIVAGVTSALIRARRHEFAIRESLGATRLRNVSLVLRELLWPVVAGVLLAMPGSIVAARALSVLAWASPTAISLAPGFRSVTALAFLVMGGLVLAVAGCAAILRLNTQASMTLSTARTWGAGSVNGRRSDAVTGLQAAVAVAVLFAATQVIVAVWSLEHHDLGHSRAGLVYGRLLPIAPGPVTDPHTHYVGLAARLQATPGIADVTFASGFPNRIRSNVRVGPTDAPTQTVTDVVADNFFSTVGINLLAGRTFADADRVGPPVAIVSHDFAIQHFGAAAPLGRRLWVGEPEVAHEIVGVVAATRAAGRGVGEPVVYRSRHQLPLTNPMVITRAIGAAGPMVPAVSQALHAHGRDYVVGLTSIDDGIRRALAPELTLRATASAVVGLVVLLTIIGLLCQQTMWASGEWASTVVRVALGEPRRSVIARVVRHSAAVMAAGVLLGLPMALVAGTAVQRVLPELGGGSPGVLVVVALLVVGLGLVCAMAPTRALALVRPSDVRRLT